MDLLSRRLPFVRQPCSLYTTGVAYLAYGISGQRLCYAKLDDGRIVVSENNPDQNGEFVGNDSMSYGSIGNFLCRQGVETDGLKMKMTCIDKLRPEDLETPTSVESLSLNGAGRYVAKVKYVGCKDDKMVVSTPVCFDGFGDLVGIVSIKIPTKTTCRSRQSRDVEIDLTNSCLNGPGILSVKGSKNPAPIRVYVP